jgi:hypothetical protein
MRIVLVLVVVAVTGCSFFTTRSPSTNDPQATCNTSEAGPAIDTAWAVVGALSAVAILQDQYNDERVTSALLVGGVTALFAGAAAYGFSNTGKCRRRTKELLADEQAQQQRAAGRPSETSVRDDAWQLTKQAQLAARSGDCPTVFALDDVVRGMDAELHRVFSRDAAIISCMSTKEITVTPPSEAAPQGQPSTSPPSSPPAPASRPAPPAPSAPPARPAPSAPPAPPAGAH